MSESESDNNSNNKLFSVIAEISAEDVHEMFHECLFRKKSHNQEKSCEDAQLKVLMNNYFVDRINEKLN
jgi:hypothetical protein